MTMTDIIIGPMIFVLAYALWAIFKLWNKIDAVEHRIWTMELQDLELDAVERDAMERKRTIRKDKK